VHYISKYESEAIEALIGRSMWDEGGLWPGWQPALREAVTRQAMHAPVVYEEGNFPLGGTLEHGRYTVVEHYLGGGFDQLWFGRSAADPEARYLIGTTIDNGFDPGSAHPALMRPSSGLFAPRLHPRSIAASRMMIARSCSPSQ
jgi:hypothetical protein